MRFAACKSIPGSSSFPSPTMTSVAKSRAPIPRIISVSASSWISTTGSVKPAPVSHCGVRLRRTGVGQTGDPGHEIREFAGRTRCARDIAQADPVRRASARARIRAPPRGLSGNVQNAHSQMTASTEASSSGNRSASPTVKLTRPASPSRSASALAWATFCALRSTPDHRAAEPLREQHSARAFP